MPVHDWTMTSAATSKTGASGPDVADLLHRLVDGLTGLRHDGRFDEPNLDGSPGDYVSFDSWEWPQGVGLYGLFRLWEQTGDARYRAVLETWYDRRIADGLPPVNVNTTAPLLALALLWDRTRVPRWQPVLDDWADRVLTGLPRTPEQGFQHIVSDGTNPDEVWVDTLFMVVLFLAAYGRATGRADLAEEALRQVLLHIRLLADRDSGLWFHGWTFRGRHNFARARWGRGNAWALAALMDYLAFSDVPGGVRAYLTDCLTSHAEALMAAQDADGGWHTLLDDPGSYVEMSATAGIAYGLLRGARRGLFPAPARAAGLRGLDLVMRSIDQNGVLQNVSYGTRMGHDLQFYRDIPLHPTGYGQALALLLLGEALHHAAP